MAVLELDDVSVTYRSAAGPVPAVRGVSLTVDTGSSLGLAGESGSGKTVLIRSIMRLLDDRHTHTEGTVRLAGLDLTELSSKELRSIWARTWCAARWGGDWRTGESSCSIGSWPYPGWRTDWGRAGS